MSKMQARQTSVEYSVTMPGGKLLKSSSRLFPVGGTGITKSLLFNAAPKLLNSNWKKEPIKAATDEHGYARIRTEDKKCHSCYMSTYSLLFCRFLLIRAYPCSSVAALDHVIETSAGTKA